MFEWIKNLFKKKEQLDVFLPSVRKIYNYFDGERLVRADPLVLYKRFLEIGTELSIDIKVSNSISKDASKAQIKALEKIRKIFDVKSLEDGGLSQVESFDLLDHFLNYCNNVKKNYPRTSTLPPNLDQTSSSRNDLPINNSSVSGSVENVGSTSKPELLPTGSQ